MMVALAALENGVPASHTVYCPGHMQLGNARFHCWKREGHGTLDMLRGIKHSCDVYFYDIARRTGIDATRAMARRFGLVDYVVPPPIDLAEFTQAAGTDRAPSSILRVAAVGQDGRRVVVASDAGLLQAAAEQAGQMCLFDPGPLRYSLGSLPAVRCFARREIDIGGMLRAADVYLHRALPWWAEDSGRALFGAMAQGIPVLCPRASSYAEYVDDGVDGFVYADGASALAAIETLRGDRARLRAMAEFARAKAMRLFEPRALANAYASVVEQWRIAA